MNDLTKCNEQLQRDNPQKMLRAKTIQNKAKEIKKDHKQIDC